MIAFAALSLLMAVIVALGWAASARRARSYQARAAELEAESLEQRRELWRLGRSGKSGAGAATATGNDATRDSAIDALAPAVRKIAAELHEARVLESLVTGVVTATHARAARVVLHDRRTDRFSRGLAARRTESGVQVAEEAPRPNEDAVVRCAMKRRERIIRDGRDPSLRTAFDPTDRGLAIAAPLFDRAIAAGVLLVDHDDPEPHGAAIDVLAAIGSLALGNARLRAIEKPGGELASSGNGGGRHA